MSVAKVEFENALSSHQSEVGHLSELCKRSESETPRLQEMLLKQHADELLQIQTESQRKLADLESIYNTRITQLESDFIESEMNLNRSWRN